jgi:hypothetical protein
MDQMEIERRKRLAAQMVHPFAPGQNGPTMPQAIGGWAKENPLDAAALATSPIPVVGDAVGLAADVKTMYDEPSLANAGWLGLGMAAPFVGGTTLKAGKDAMLQAMEARRPANAPSAQLGGELPEFSPYDLPPGSNPRYLGAAEDRTTMSHLRYNPPKLAGRTTRALAAMRDPANPQRLKMMEDIKHGINKFGADSWYNTEELRDWFITELGDKEGLRQWSEFLDLVGAASPGSKVPANLKNATAMRRRLYDGLPEDLNTMIPSRNITYAEALQNGESHASLGSNYGAALEQTTDIEAGRALARGRAEGYGHKVQGSQELVAARQQQGDWSGAPEPGVLPRVGSATNNPKPKGFSWSLKGSEANIAADLHFTRYMAMASRDPAYLTNTGEIGEGLKSTLIQGNPKLKNFIKETERNGKKIITFKAQDAEKAGQFSIDQALDIPGVWADMPNANEYAAFEGFLREVGGEMGLTAPQVQAAMWMGAADRTGVDVSSQGTFMELFRNVADKQAAETGKTRAETIKDFIESRELLSLLPIGVGGAMVAGRSGSAEAATPQDRNRALAERLMPYMQGQGNGNPRLGP